MGLPIMLAVLSVASCKPAAAHSESYFETHDTDRSAVLEQCQNGETAYQPHDECGAALRAKHILDIKQDAAGGVH